jgi:uncharacterized protein
MVEAAEGELASPCIGICRVDGADVCLGCGRTIDEICGWIRSTPARKAEILRLAEQRRALRPESPS